MKRNETRPIQVGGLQIGHQNRVVLQSMTNVPVKDTAKSRDQILELEDYGCELIRVAVLDEEDSRSIAALKKEIHIPVVADIHFNHLLALNALDQGVDAIRINPGNIGERSHTEAVVRKCKERNVPIRIGINSGSLEKPLIEKYGGPCAAAMVESAKRHVQILEDLDFHDICLSFKSSNVPLTIASYEAAAEAFTYPLHLGVTEAGSFTGSAVKSSAALGTLLHEGLGDTIRVSVSGPPKEELVIAKQLLRCMDLYDNTPDLIACPTCGRIQYDMLPLVKEIEEYLQTIHENITVAIMGCPVNGIQEAGRADIGVAGSKDGGILFRKGEIIRQIPTSELASSLKAEIQAFLKERKESL